jgi:hypothetical protein
MKIDQMQYLFKLQTERIDSQDKIDFEPHEIDAYINRAIWIFLKDRYGILPDNPKRGFETDQMRISQFSNLHVKSPHLQPGITPVLLEDGLYEINLNELGQNINGQYFRYLFLTTGVVKAKKGNCTKKFTLKPRQSDDKLTVYTESNWTWRIVNYNFGKSTFVLDNDATLIDSPDTISEVVDSTSSRNNSDELSSLYLDTRDKYGDSQFEITEVYLSYIKYPNRVFSGGYNHIDGLSKSNSPQIHCDFDSLSCNDIITIAVRLAEKDIISNYEAMLQDEIRDIKR